MNAATQNPEIMEEKNKVVVIYFPEMAVSREEISIFEAIDHDNFAHAQN